VKKESDGPLFRQLINATAQSVRFDLTEGFQSAPPPKGVQGLDMEVAKRFVAYRQEHTLTKMTLETCTNVSTFTKPNPTPVEARARQCYKNASQAIAAFEKSYQDLKEADKKAPKDKRIGWKGLEVFQATAHLYRAGFACILDGKAQQECKSMKKASKRLQSANEAWRLEREGGAGKSPSAKAKTAPGPNKPGKPAAPAPAAGCPPPKLTAY
jgi:hypothetical protein